MASRSFPGSLALINSLIKWPFVPWPSQTPKSQ